MIVDITCIYIEIEISLKTLNILFIVDYYVDRIHCIYNQ